MVESAKKLAHLDRNMFLRYISCLMRPLSLLLVLMALKKFLSFVCKKFVIPVSRDHILSLRDIIAKKVKDKEEHTKIVENSGILYCI